MVIWKEGGEGMTNLNFERLCEENENSYPKDECIIAFKVYDQCRQQDCLTPAMLGPAVYAGPTGCTLGGEVETNGSMLMVPSSATSAVIVPGSVHISDILIPGKTPNQLKPGYYNVDLKIIISYTLRFADIDGIPILLICGYNQSPDVLAESVCTKQVTLFGSTNSDVTAVSDLMTLSGSGSQAAPFVYAEAKAVGLDSGIKSGNVNTVDVTMGLFVIIKLCRTVPITVESKGFCEPQPRTNISPDPREFFNSLEFPFTAFNPPLKDVFLVTSE